jgi:tRNA (cmo5U34)-methyltransferase
VAPLRDALHLCISLILSELPVDANILCVGVGTGLELIYLAENFPQWRFTAVEPAAPMLNVCRQKVEELGITSRCTFHEGYIDSLPPSVVFDAATCLLVSHFILQQDERSNFFSQIAARLRPNGYLVSADLVSDTSTLEYQSLIEVWPRMLKYAEIPAEEVEKFHVSYGRDVALLPPQTVEAIIIRSDLNRLYYFCKLFSFMLGILNGLLESKFLTLDIGCNPYTPLTQNVLIYRDKGYSSVKVLKLF